MDCLLFWIVIFVGSAWLIFSLYVVFRIETYNFLGLPETQEYLKKQGRHYNA